MQWTVLPWLYLTVLTFGFLMVYVQSEDEGNLMGYGSPHYGSAIYEENNYRALSTERGDHDDSFGESPDRALLDFPFSRMRLSPDDCQDGRTKELCHQVASGKVEVPYMYIYLLVSGVEIAINPIESLESG